MGHAHLGSLPNRLRMLAVVLDNGKNAGSDDAMGAAEVVVDFCGGQARWRGFGTGRGGQNVYLPCRVSVMDCSSFSSSSVRERLRCGAMLWRDIMCSGAKCQSGVVCPVLVLVLSDGRGREDAPQTSAKSLAPPRRLPSFSPSPHSSSIPSLQPALTPTRLLTTGYRRLLTTDYASLISYTSSGALNPELSVATPCRLFFREGLRSSAYPTRLLYPGSPACTTYIPDAAAGLLKCHSIATICPRSNCSHLIQSTQSTHIHTQHTNSNLSPQFNFAMSNRLPSLLRSSPLSRASTLCPRRARPYTTPSSTPRTAIVTGSSRGM
jgi:hypothetical protein